MQRTFKVSGMTCGGCQRSVERVVGKVEGVKQVDVDLATGAVVVHGQASSASVQAAIRGAGFEVESA